MPTMLTTLDEGLTSEEKKDAIRSYVNKLAVSKKYFYNADPYLLKTKLQTLLAAFNVKNVSSLEDTDLDYFYQQLNTIQ